MSHNSKGGQPLPHQINPLRFGDIGPDDHYEHLVPTGLKVYKNDVVVTYENGRTGEEWAGGERGKCGQWSWQSRKRLMFYAANTEVNFQTMLTLTYPDIESDGKAVKSHLNHVLTRLRQMHAPLSYLWFLEWQRRGAPHFHVLTNCFVDKDWIAAEWYRIVGSGNPDHLAAGTRAEGLRSVDGGKRYAVKYAAKMRQKEIPEEYQNVGRMWGCSRDVPPKVKQEIAITGGYQELVERLREWKYCGRLYQEPVALLYGAADCLTGK